MAIRSRVKPLSFHRDQLVFEFMQKDKPTRVKRSEEASKRAKKRRMSKKLFDWLETDFMDIPEDVVILLDALITQRRNEIRDKWTPVEEAERRGVDCSRMTQVVNTDDGRIVQPCCYAFVPSGGIDEYAESN